MNTNYELLRILSERSLNSLLRILDKAEAHVKEREVAETDLLNARLAPDMMNFTQQVQVATDNARKNLARLAGKEPVAMEDTETTIGELKERVAKSLEVIRTFSANDFSEADTREIRLPWFQGTYMLGKDFVNEFAVPNLFFHVVTAYDILRAQGVLIGKSDYIGEMSMKLDVVA
jgi:hypothetical protein